MSMRLSGEAGEHCPDPRLRNVLTQNCLTPEAGKAGRLNGKCMEALTLSPTTVGVTHWEAQRIQSSGFQGLLDHAVTVQLV